MSWPDIASAAVEQSARPLVIVDGLGIVRVANHAFAKLLGRTRRELVDTPLVQVLHRVGATSSEQDCFAGLMKTTRSQWLVASSMGCELLLAVDVEPYGDGSSRGALISVRGVVARQAQGASDLDFEIETNAQRFGTLRRLALIGREFDQEVLADQRCYQLLYNRSAPCEDCPGVSLSDGCNRVCQVRPIAGDADAYETITATATDRGTALVTRRRLDGDVLRHAFTTKLASLARQAGLSVREREVLDHLLRGVSLEDIALAMGIERRTVKFHQTNLLSKLGATSRADLLRLLI